MGQNVILLKGGEGGIGTFMQNPPFNFVDNKS